MSTLAELRDEFRIDAVRRAIDMAKEADAAAREVLTRELEHDGWVGDPAKVAQACGASAQAWAAVAALLAPNGVKD